MVFLLFLCSQKLQIQKNCMCDISYAIGVNHRLYFKIISGRANSFKSLVKP